VARTELLSQSLITKGSESLLNVAKLLRALQMWCDAPDSMTHFGVETVKAQAVSRKEWQSPVVGRAVVVVAFFTFHHSIIHL